MAFDHGTEHRDENMVLIQANLDDMNPEFTSHVTDRLFEGGANDVYWVPMIMKKGRPGIMLNVLAQRDRLALLEEIIFQETTTLGLRYMDAVCHRLGRSIEAVETRWGPVNVKFGYYNGRCVQYAPEHDQCAQIAKREGVPLKRVYDEVRHAAKDRFIRAGDGGNDDGAHGAGSPAK